MPELPGFMSEIAARVHGRLSQNNAPSATDGSQVTTYDYTHGNKYVPGREPVGHKTVNAKAGVSNVPSASGGNSKANQIAKRKRRGK